MSIDDESKMESTLPDLTCLGVVVIVSVVEVYNPGDVDVVVVGGVRDNPTESCLDSSSSVFDYPFYSDN